VNNAYPDIQGWAMIGGWPLFTSTLLTDLNPNKIKVASVDALPEQLAYVDKGVVPVLPAQSVYLWGDVGVRTIVDELHFNNRLPPARAMRSAVRTARARAHSERFSPVSTRPTMAPCSSTASRCASTDRATRSPRASGWCIRSSPSARISPSRRICALARSQLD